MNPNDKKEVFRKIKLAQGGDESAKEQLVKDNIKLVHKIAQHYKNSTCEYEDIIQSGMVGLVNAILRFDPSYNVAFSTYAFPLILGEIRKLLRENSMIKKSRSVNETLSLIQRKKQEFINVHKREPTINELSTLCGIEREKIVFVLNSILPVQSLESKIYDSEDLLVDKIESNENTQDNAINNVLIDKITKDLDKRSKKIIYMRYYQGKTQSDVAKEIGVSQVQISRIEKKDTFRYEKNDNRLILPHIEYMGLSKNNVGDKMDKSTYKAYIDLKAPKEKKARNLILAFLVGGAICTFSQAVFELYIYLQIVEETAYSLTTSTLIVIGATLTGVGIYDKLGKFAGAGSAVPVTGFANSVVSPAMEYKCEGIIFGTAVKMFTIAGPVLICGTSISVIIGLIYYTIGLFGK